MGASTQTPIRVGFVLNTFTFGGSETETIELINGADPNLLQFTGIAVAHPLPLPANEPRRDLPFPPIYRMARQDEDWDDPRLRIVGDFKEAVEIVTRNSDIIVTWGLPKLQEFLPAGRLPKIVVHSKDSGDWAKSFLMPNSLITKYYTANSTMSAAAFPVPFRHSVKVIHNGINPRRVAPTIPRIEQRKLWGFIEEDKIAGYLGRIERDKGLWKTVQGLARLGREWKAVFIGVTPNSSFADELAHLCETSIPGRYRLLPWSHDVGSALAAFDVFCHPSEHEGFSNSIAEAWLAGAPTVYTIGTGAIPDLGEVGVGVSPDADGGEIAAAILRAYGNRELVGRARNVVEHGFLVGDNVCRWTNYLTEVHKATQTPRAMFLFPEDLAASAQKWLSVFRRPGVGVELCCVVFENSCGARHSAADADVRAEHQCGCFHVSGAHDLETLVQYARPDVVLTFPSLSVARLLSPRLSTSVLILPSTPEPESVNWIHWSRYFTQKANSGVLTKS